MTLARTPPVSWQPVVELPWAALRAPPGGQREATTQAMRDIGQELRQSWSRAPPQPFGRAGFWPDSFVARRRTHFFFELTGVDFLLASRFRPNRARAASREFHHGLLG